ncbi:Hydroxyacylglutathione hydrolase (EC [Olavius sp. associated proteobacterium Delta 1]|nr:Hydroxyacylglutathione hydrolase (EC [Olavius sp. associated proteobacterium Delta 1]
MTKKTHHFDTKRFITSLDKNQYLLISRDEAAVIDVSESHAEIGQIIDDLGVKLKYLLITHAHKSHLEALPDMKKKYGGTFCLHEYECELLKKTESSLEPDRIVNDKESLQLGDIEIEVLLTAGHTKGSVCYYVPKAAALFSGSTFLRRGYGKIWGPKSMSLMLFSLKRLSYNIPAKTKIYTGSGDLTKMGNEGWVQCLRSV